MICFMHVATIRHLNYSVSGTRVTSKQSQSHRNSNNNIDPRQSYNRAKFVRSCFKCVREFFFFYKYMETCQLSPFRMRELDPPQKKKEKEKRWYSHDLLDVLNDSIKF